MSATKAKLARAIMPDGSERVAMIFEWAQGTCTLYLSGDDAIGFGSQLAEAGKLVKSGIVTPESPAWRPE